MPHGADHVKQQARSQRAVTNTHPWQGKAGSAGFFEESGDESNRETDHLNARRVHTGEQQHEREEQRKQERRDCEQRDAIPAHVGLPSPPARQLRAQLGPYLDNLRQTHARQLGRHGSPGT
jgi:hypothetical protein